MYSPNCPLESSVLPNRWIGMFASVNSAGAGVDWAHYSGSGELGGSDLAYSFVVDGSDWLVGVPAIRLPAGVSPDFCVACDDLGTNPFVDATLQLGDLLGRGDPDLCLDPGAPVTCLDPGYWGGPMGPLP